MRIQIVGTLALFAVALTPGAVRADSQQDQQACMSDAMAICGQFIPDRERVAACLLANRNHLSSGCRTALTRFTPKRPSAKTASR